MANLHKKEYYGDNVAEVTTVLKYKCGIHARPCKSLCDMAEKFNSKIQVTAKGKTFDAKSLLSWYAAQILYNTEITISASGSDASEAVKALIERIDLMGE